MLRGNPASSMQKTYDEAYLTCSTAIYFEKQNNEEQALRSWREALDHIYYHNAYKIPANYRPKSETEKALQDSLRDMELQCKERLDLLEAMKKSRGESMRSRSYDSGHSNGVGNSQRPYPMSQTLSARGAPNGTIGEGTVPASNYVDIARPTLPYRTVSRVSKEDVSGRTTPTSNSAATTLKPPSKKTSRSPSPDKKSAVLKSTLRQDKKDGSKPTAGRIPPTLRSRPPKSAAQAATLAWPGQNQPSAAPGPTNTSSSNLASQINNNISRRESTEQTAPNSNGNYVGERKTSDGFVKPPSPSDFLHQERPQGYQAAPPRRSYDQPPSWPTNPELQRPSSGPVRPSQPPPPPPHRSRRQQPQESVNPPQVEESAPTMLPPPPPFPTYRKEYPNPAPIDPRKVQSVALNPPSPNDTSTQADLNRGSPRPPVPRKAVGTRQPAAPTTQANSKILEQAQSSSIAMEQGKRARRPKKDVEAEPLVAELPSENVDSPENASAAWDARVAHLLKNLPRGVDEQAAKAIFNEIVIKGDEVYWDDVAGLEIAKKALKEAVVYPFLRPDLFMGLREPARGMLLFGPPGTGKTMLARAVATESKSTFFAISASSLTSKFLGESEKLVRALFALAKALAPSIIFVDEIDSLLSSRSGSGEHEATRRIKTEFLIQWSDLAKAAAGREQTDKAIGDASRVLVLAATNLPWAIDEAARRRFVRRQYIPLPEDPVRGDQLRRLMSAQKHKLDNHDMEELIVLTDGFSGSDITALAKDAAMGPLRSLGEQLLSMSPDEIRPIMFQDFEASLVNIRPSVSKQGLKEFEDWAKEFGERGG